MKITTVTSLSAIKRTLFGVAGFLLFFQAAAWAAGTASGSVQIKNVQTGEVYFDNDDISYSSTITAVDQTKSIILLYNAMDADVNATQNVSFTANFEANNSVIIQRDGATQAGTVRYYVIEFADGVYVQRGMSSFAPGAPSNSDYITKQVSLTNAAEPANSFVLIQSRTAVTVSGADDITTITGALTDDHTLKLDRLSSNNALKSVNMVWQVVEFHSISQVAGQQNFNIYKNVSTIPINQVNNGAAGDLISGATIVDLTHSFLFFTYRADPGTIGVDSRYKVSGKIKDTTHVLFTRGLQDSTLSTSITVQW